MTDINLGPLKNGPHAELVRGLAEKCYADSTIQASWIGGSLAAGTGDEYSDIDFRIAVEPGLVESWSDPNWEGFLPLPSYGGSFMRFGNHALLHHLILADGTILDFYVQDTTTTNPEPSVVILTCGNDELRKFIEGFASAPDPLAKEVDNAVVRQFFIDYWITTHKELKGLSRNYDLTPFVGLYFERIALLRAWYMLLVGKDIDSRLTIHVLGAINKGLEGKLTTSQLNMLGMPSRTPEETVHAVDAIRDEMALAGRSLDEIHGFAYPYELENVVRQIWDERKESFIGR